MVLSLILITGKCHCLSSIARYAANWGSHPSPAFCSLVSIRTSLNLFAPYQILIVFALRFIELHKIRGGNKFLFRF